MSYQKLSLRAQLLLLVICIVLAGFALTLGFMIHCASALQQFTALQHVQELAEKFSKQASVPVLRAIDTSRTIPTPWPPCSKVGMQTASWPIKC